MQTKAVNLIKAFKGENYIFGMDIFDQLGKLTMGTGKRVSLVVGDYKTAWMTPLVENSLGLLLQEGIEICGEIIEGARPNAPREDVFRIATAIQNQNPQIVLSIGSGSSIDATKAAIAYSILSDLNPDLDAYFGNGMITQLLQTSGRKIIPLIAVQTAASSGAHLTKYSNITNVTKGQKMLIVDDAIVPPKALFDYSTTLSQPVSLTQDGALDAVSHCLEVIMGIPEEKYAQASDVCLTGMSLVIQNLETVMKEPGDRDAREAIGLGSDLGGYAIMIGGTNGAHLNSFSLTDILTHGRACALMNPYYLVFFSTAIEKRIREVGALYAEKGFITKNLSKLSGRELGIAVAEGMMKLGRSIGFPVTLKEVHGFNHQHIERCLTAAKNPKLDSKLKNMPVPLSAELVDEYMGSILEAATSGDLSKVKNLHS